MGASPCSFHCVTVVKWEPSSYLGNKIHCRPKLLQCLLCQNVSKCSTNPGGLKGAISTGQNFHLSFELKQKQIWMSELWVRNQQRVVSL